MGIADLLQSVGIAAAWSVGVLILADIVFVILTMYIAFRIIKYALSWFTDGSNGLNLIGMLIAWRVPGARWAIASMMGTNTAANSSRQYKRKRNYKRRSNYSR
ncbi:hypothetical protein Pan241w_22230 [Gimesia alba]|uniref:Uncharacterized protein n=1 Tax=Gimesia alba TaxID=2527973 RepID=A0A517RE36_9PLAN|nr:hypothetical protein Pan241w_22230 [Gimesia alba]